MTLDGIEDVVVAMANNFLNGTRNDTFSFIGNSTGNNLIIVYSYIAC